MDLLRRLREDYAADLLILSDAGEALDLGQAAFVCLPAYPSG